MTNIHFCRSLAIQKCLLILQTGSSIVLGFNGSLNDASAVRPSGCKVAAIPEYPRAKATIISSLTLTSSKLGTKYFPVPPGASKYMMLLSYWTRVRRLYPPAIISRPSSTSDFLLYVR